mgnify:CR=1 FL=1
MVKASKIIAEQKEELESQRDKLAHQHQLLEEKNREITNFNNNLERLVTERTKELEESLYQIRKYQHDLAHNIRAPYVTLMGLINLIKDERFDSNEKCQRLRNVARSCRFRSYEPCRTSTISRIRYSSL